VAGLYFVTQPSARPFGQVIKPAISVRAINATGGPVAGASVTISLLSNPTAATLSGTLVATTNSAGVAVFSNLAINKIGTYTLEATSTGLTSGTSATFRMTSQADLTVEAIALSPVEPNSSDDIEISVKITNIGTGAAGESTTAIQLSTEESGVSIVTPALAAGVFTVVTRTVNLPPGERSVTVKADAGDAVSEVDEENNERTRDFFVNSVPSP
jgi:subtilase family serine protease